MNGTNRTPFSLAAKIFVAAAVALAAVWGGVRAFDNQVEPDPQLAMMGGGFEPWTSAGSTGNVDEADIGLYVAKSSIMEIAAGAPDRAVLNVRYNVTPAPGLVNPLDGYQIALRYRDNGSDAVIVAKLKEYNMATGSTKTLLKFNSNQEDPDPGFQTGFAFDCSGNLVLDFTQNIYYVDVVIKRTSASGTPAVAGIQCGAIVCP